jgi:hypothetical protein
MGFSDFGKELLPGVFAIWGKAGEGFSAKFFMTHYDSG